MEGIQAAKNGETRKADDPEVEGTPGRTKATEAAVYTHTPGGKPAPGFTFGIARPLLGPATMSSGSTGWRDGPPGRAKVDPEESHNQLPLWRNYRA